MLTQVSRICICSQINAKTLKNLQKNSPQLEYIRSVLVMINYEK